MKRTAHCDSVGFAVDTAKRLNKALPEPAQPLDAAAMGYWPAIIKAKRLSAWTGIDLALATSLARDLVSIDELRSYFLADNDATRSKVAKALAVDFSGGAAPYERLILRKELMRLPAFAAGG